jgi:hypothetical protein
LSVTIGTNGRGTGALDVAVSVMPVCPAAAWFSARDAVDVELTGLEGVGGETRDGGSGKVEGAGLFAPAVKLALVTVSRMGLRWTNFSGSRSGSGLAGVFGFRAAEPVASGGGNGTGGSAELGTARFTGSTAEA